MIARADHLFTADPDGWLHTGDLGRIGDEGYLYLVGRRGDMIIRGGENVYPQEVENRLLEHPRIAGAAVVGVPDRLLGETIKAFVVPTDPADPPPSEELRAFARAALAGFKVRPIGSSSRRYPATPPASCCAASCARKDADLAAHLPKSAYFAHTGLRRAGAPRREIQ